MSARLYIFNIYIHLFGLRKHIHLFRSHYFVDIDDVLSKGNNSFFHSSTFYN
jgi:hypothetical protein